MCCWTYHLIYFVWLQAPPCGVWAGLCHGPALQAGLCWACPSPGRHSSASHPWAPLCPPCPPQSRPLNPGHQSPYQTHMSPSSFIRVFLTLDDPCCLASVCVSSRFDLQVPPSPHISSPHQYHPARYNSSTVSYFASMDSLGLSHVLPIFCAAVLLGTYDFNQE